ncbi:MAG: DUF4294 domain-containing protein [Culturomica sp.]|nr:DUF4294 domain-containing protein [Culturomica sp.]
MQRTLLLLLSLLCTEILSAQQQIFPALIVGTDTIPVIRLEEVVIKAKGISARKYNRYTRQQARLEYNVRKVYPYARIAAGKIAEIETRLQSVPNKSRRNEVIKKEYNELMRSFKQPLMKLSVTQGRILVRLIYRETQSSAFGHIREYRGGVNAYFWQSLALLFGNNLKAAYDPYGEDYDIEEIVRKIENGAPIVREDSKTVR